jgi:hypothetical protein
VQNGGQSTPNPAFLMPFFPTFATRKGIRIPES